MKSDALLNGTSAGDAARTLGVAPAVAKEYLLAAEGKGMIFIITPGTYYCLISSDQFSMQSCCVGMSVLMGFAFT